MFLETKTIQYRERCLEKFCPFFKIAFALNFYQVENLVITSSFQKVLQNPPPTPTQHRHHHKKKFNWSKLRGMIKEPVGQNEKSLMKRKSYVLCDEAIQ